MNSKEPSQRGNFFENPKQLLKMRIKKTYTFLAIKFLVYTYKPAYELLAYTVTPV